MIPRWQQHKQEERLLRKELPSDDGYVQLFGGVADRSTRFHDFFLRLSVCLFL